MWTPRPASELRIAASGATRVLPSPVFISEILPWWRTTPPISWTSKWRMPSVRCIASRVIAKTSAGDVVEGRLDLGVLPLAAVLRELAAALEVGVVELVLGRLLGLGDLADLVADLGEAGADLLVGEGLISASSSFASSTNGWMRQLAVVRVDETGKESHGR